MRTAVLTCWIATCLLLALPGWAADATPSSPAVRQGAEGTDAQRSLVEAARHRDRETALTRIREGADVNEAGNDGTTALHWAAHYGDAELVKQLLKAGARANVTNDFGATPMQEAAELGDAAILKALLAAGADVESPNAEGQTALMTVARTGSVEAAKLLIAKGADVNAHESWRGQTALMWAAAQSQPEIVKLLVGKGADVDARSTVRQWARRVTAEPRPQNRPPGGFTALLLAAREGCVDCARALVKGRADIDLADPENISPLLMAILNARFDVAAYLIESGADVNKWDTWGRAPLYSAIDYNTVPRGGRPDRPSLDRTSPLQVAEMLLARGANPNMQLKLFPPYRSLGQDRGGDSMLTVGTTPLLRAAKAGDTPAVRLLLKNGALPDLPNSLGITPLMAAAGIGSTTVDTRARFRNEKQCIDSGVELLAAGADVNARRDNGQTALHGAALWGWNDYVKFLAKHGADLQAKDRSGLTALDVALGKVGGTGRQGVSQGEAHKDTAELLQQLAAGSPAQPPPAAMAGDRGSAAL